jgi:hypothetical protein
VENKLMEFDSNTQRIFLTSDQREATDRTEFFGGLPIEGLPLLQAQVAGLLAVSEVALHDRAGKSSVELFALRRQRNTLEQMQEAFPAIQQRVWGELFEEPPTSCYLLD